MFNINVAIAQMDAPIKFNLSKFKGTLIPMQNNKSIGGCATAVRTFLQVAGIDVSNRPAAAYQYINWLPTIGFRHIATLDNKVDQAEWTASHACAGDIAVMEHGKYGHICMFNGKNWISDFKQKNMYVYSGGGVCMIFRYIQ
jgi:hypothetical protein